MSQAQQLAVAIKSKAQELGFDLAGIAPAVRPDGVDWLRRWLDQGFAGEMDYIPRREVAYEHPRGVMPAVRSVVMLAMNYFVGQDSNLPDSSFPTGQVENLPHGRIARYAWGSSDYHDLLRDRLRQLADFLHGLRKLLCGSGDGTRVIAVFHAL